MATPSSQIREYVLDQIRKRSLGPGDRIPSRPEMEKRFGCARATVDKALAELKREGVIRSELGRGTFVADARKKATPSGRPTVVIPAGAREIQKDLFVFGIYRELAKGLTASGGKTHSTLEEPRSADDPAFRSLLKSPLVYWVRPSPSAEPLMQRLADGRVPQILLNRDYGEFPCIATDAIAGQRAAVEYLVELGHKKIGFAHPPTTHLGVFNSERLIGFLDGIHRCGIAPDDAPQLEVSYEDGRNQGQAVRAWISGPNAPSAVIIPCYMAGTLMRTCRETSRRVPEDLSVLTIDEVHDPHGLYGLDFTCERQRLGEIGRRAAGLAPSSFTSKDRPVKMRLAPDLVVGNTTSPPVGRTSGKKAKRR